MSQDATVAPILEAAQESLILGLRAAWAVKANAVRNFDVAFAKALLAGVPLSEVQISACMSEAAVNRKIDKLGMRDEL